MRETFVRRGCKGKDDMATQSDAARQSECWLRPHVLPEEDLEGTNMPCMTWQDHTAHAAMQPVEGVAQSTEHDDAQICGSSRKHTGAA